MIVTGFEAIDLAIDHLWAPLLRTQFAVALHEVRNNFAFYGAKVIGILIVAVGVSKPASLTSTSHPGWAASQRPLPTRPATMRRDTVPVPVGSGVRMWPPEILQPVALADEGFCFRSYLGTARKHGLGGRDVLGRLFRGDVWMPPATT